VLDGREELLTVEDGWIVEPDVSVAIHLYF
jgi:hypothetical protein